MDPGNLVLRGSAWIRRPELLVVHLMRFLTYNIAGCEHRQDRFLRGMEALLSDIRSLDADVVALQEVHDETSADVSFLKRLADLGYETMHFGPTMRRPGSAFGNILMARGLVHRVRELDLTWRDREPRGAIGFFLESGGQEYEVYSTHLGLGRRERADQVERLANWMQSGESSRETKAIRIVMGDFNEWNPCSATNRELGRWFGRGPRIASFPTGFPLFSLDRIFVSPAKELGLRWKVHRERGRFRSSDHLPLTLDLA